MENWRLYSLLGLFILAFSFLACDDNADSGETPTANDFTDLLTNQVTEVILPSMNNYQAKMGLLSNAASQFSSSLNATSLNELKSAYQDANLAYQAAAVHNYFATANQGLVSTTNLYPVDLSLLENLIQTESYDFNTTAQQRANGFPALDYMLYGNEDALAYFNGDIKRLAFLQALVDHMLAKATTLATQWNGDLKNNFIENGGTSLGSSISVQLNESLIYLEEHIRENKVGIPIGRLGPNDSPIAADPSKIEAYYQAQADENEQFTMALLKAAVEELEDLYLGTTSSNTNGQGYDDLLLARQQTSIDTDIKAQFSAIYAKINARNSISGDESLYNSLQELITLYKSDLFPILNVQDADGANDGD